ncbi:MAG: hypothetical protein V4505_15355 [Pseudomonadota bacterium]
MFKKLRAWFGRHAENARTGDRRENTYAPATEEGQASPAAFYVETRWGGNESSPSVSRMKEIIGELATKDEEHPDTWLVHEPTAWSIRLDESGCAYLEDEESEIVAHMQDVSAEHALQLWTRLSTMGRAGVDKEPWKKGDRPVDEAELAKRQAHAAQRALEGDRDFYDMLGPERQDFLCRWSGGCTRGHIQYSVLCRTHHYAQIRGKCPFDD